MPYEGELQGVTVPNQPLEVVLGWRYRIPQKHDRNIQGQVHRLLSWRDARTNVNTS